MGFSHCLSEEKGIYWLSVMGEGERGNIIKMDCNTNAMQDLTELTAWPYRNDLLISGSDLKISQITDLSPPKYSFRSDLRKVVAVTWDSFVLDGACWSKDNFVELLQPRCIILLVLGLSPAPVLKDLWPMFPNCKGVPASRYWYWDADLYFTFLYEAPLHHKRHVSVKSN